MSGAIEWSNLLMTRLPFSPFMGSRGRRRLVKRHRNAAAEVRNRRYLIN